MKLDWITILGIIGSVASLIGLFFAFKPSKKHIEIKTDNNLTTTVVQKNINIIKIEQIFNELINKVNVSKKCVPTSFLTNLPKIKYNSYLQARALWNTGVTAKMLEGNNLLFEKLYEILLELAELSIEEDKLNNKPVKDFYKEKIQKLTKLAYDAQPLDRGTMHIVIASGEAFNITDEFIVNLVKNSVDNTFFSDWIIKWKNAEKFAIENKDIDFHLTNEL